MDGVLHLPNATKLYPYKDVCGWERKSTRAQAGPKKSKLIASGSELSQQLRTAAPGRFIETFTAVESGKLSGGKKRFKEAIAKVREANGILASFSLSRMLRPEAFDYRTNLHAIPTDAEMKELLEMTKGVVLATILPPDATESERRHEAICRPGTAGRKSKSKEHTWKIFKLLGRKREGRWEHSLSFIATRVGCSKTSIIRLLQQPAPAELVGKEVRWGELPCPSEIFDQISP